MLGLAHLVVDAGRDYTTLSQMLPLFTSLKTLSLGSIMGSWSIPFNALHLDGLQELRSVTLIAAYPLHSIRLPEGCELHVNITGRGSLRRIWSTVSWVSVIIKV